MSHHLKAIERKQATVLKSISELSDALRRAETSIVIFWASTCGYCHNLLSEIGPLLLPTNEDGKGEIPQDPMVQWIFVEDTEDASLFPAPFKEMKQMGVPRSFVLTKSGTYVNRPLYQIDSQRIVRLRESANGMMMGYPGLPLYLHWIVAQLPSWVTSTTRPSGMSDSTVALFLDALRQQRALEPEFHTQNERERKKLPRVDPSKIPPSSIASTGGDVCKNPKCPNHGKPLVHPPSGAASGGNVAPPSSVSPLAIALRQDPTLAAFGKSAPSAGPADSTRSVNPEEPGPVEFEYDSRDKDVPVVKAGLSLVRLIASDFKVPVRVVEAHALPHGWISPIVRRLALPGSNAPQNDEALAMRSIADGDLALDVLTQWYQYLREAQRALRQHQIKPNASIKS